MKILIIKHHDEDTHNTFYTEENIKRLEGIADLSYLSIIDPGYESKLKKELKDTDICMTCWGIEPFSKELLDSAKKLKMIAHTGGSATHVYSEEIRRRGIIILSGNKFFAESVAEGTVAYMFMGQRKIYSYLKDMEFKGWQQTYYYTNGLRYKTIGLLGFGMIAKYVAKMLSGFEVKIKVAAEYDIPYSEAEKYNVEVCSKEELFETSDVISVHMGLNETTYHFVDKNLLSLMKEDSLLVNTARGAIINEADLTDVLKTGKIRAVIDVYEEEPLPLESGLRGLENVTLFPHKGGPTTDIRKYIVSGLTDDIEKFMKGEENLEFKIEYEYIKYMTNEKLCRK